MGRSGEGGENTEVVGRILYEVCVTVCGQYKECEGIGELRGGDLRKMRTDFWMQLWETPAPNRGLKNTWKNREPN